MGGRIFDSWVSYGTCCFKIVCLSLCVARAHDRMAEEKAEAARQLVSKAAQEAALEAAFGRYMEAYESELEAAREAAAKYKNTTITKTPPKRVMEGEKLVNVTPGSVSWHFKC